MNNGRGERRLMAFTVAVLVLYAPIETWYSMPELWNPFFLVDLVGMVLLVVGVLVLRRDAVPRRVGMLIAGYALDGCQLLAWFFGRVSEVSAGGVLDYGALELCFTACILAATVAGLGWALVLSTRAVPDARE